VREHRFLITEPAVEALRRLRTPWTGYHVSHDTLTVTLQDGGVVAVAVEGTQVEPELHAERLTAAVAAAGAMVALPAGGEAAGDLGVGRNDIVVFHAETWTEPAGPDGRVTQFTGRPLLRPESAEAVCLVTDAVVVATPAGTGLLVRCGFAPRSIEVVTDRRAIARFVTERGYEMDAGGG
jgi:hypothetical protein